MRVKIESRSKFLLKSLAVMYIVIFTCPLSCVDDILKHQRLIKLTVSAQLFSFFRNFVIFADNL